MGNRGGSGQKVNSKIINKGEGRGIHFNIQALHCSNVNFKFVSLRDLFVKERKGQNVTFENWQWHIKSIKTSKLGNRPETVRGRGRTKC